MDKQTFISLIRQYNSSTADHADTLKSLKSQFPYSQVVQALYARVAHDHAITGHESALQLAAVYASDRTALKEVFIAPYVKPLPVSDRAPEIENIESKTAVSDVIVVSSQPSGKVEEVHVAVANAAAQAVEQKETDHRNVEPAITEDVADEVMRDLERLNTLRHRFEMLFVEYNEVESRPLKTGGTIYEIETDPKPILQKSASDSDHAPLKGKSKKERIVELAKAMKATDGDGAKTPLKKKRDRKEKKDDQDVLIEEIESNKQEIGIDSEKQKEQLELINQFIRSQPSISNAKDRQVVPAGDLNPIKSGEFTDNIISETLVEILVRQGKKDKAIEVLKKLIWKYPQKKSYFASQIEELKK